MFYPVLGSVLGEGEVLDTTFVDMTVKLKEDTEANFRENRMCGLWDDVIAREAVSGGGEATRNEELPDREM